MHLSKISRLLLGICAIILVSVWSLALPVTARAWGSIQPLPNIPDNVRRPRIAGEGNYFHVIFQKEDNKILYYSRGIADTNGAVVWSSPTVLATGVEGDWDIAADAAGTLHVVYGTADNRVVYSTNAQHGTAGAWSAPQKIASAPGNVNGIEITFDSAQVPYVAWGEGIATSTLLIAYLTDGTWKVRDANNKIYLVRYPQIAVVGSGDSATIHVMYEIESGDHQPFYAGYTRGTRTGKLTNSNFSRSFFDPGYANTPTLVVDPTSNVLYAGFLAGSIGQGYAFQFTISTNNGASWSELRAIAISYQDWADKTPLVVDNGTLYMMLPAKHWSGKATTRVGYYDIRYSAATNSFSTPVAIRDENSADYKNASPDYALNAVAKGAIWVTGFTQNIFYNADPGGLVSRVNGQLALNNGAAATNNSTVTVTVGNVSGDPTQMRVAVDGDPSDATPLQPFNASFPLALPASSACSRTVAVQLVNAAGAVSPILRASIVLDTSVQATTAVRNPYKRSNAVFPSVGNARVVDDGDDAYTRDQTAYVEVNGLGECTGLKQVQIGGDAATLGAPYAISNNVFAQVLPLPAPAQVGPNPVALQVSDVLGNTQPFAQTLIYDPAAPTLTTPGTVQVTVPTAGPNMLVTLTFSGNAVSDNLYPGRGFWGVWLANSRTPSADPLNDASLVWVTQAAPGSSADFALPNWDVLSGIAPAAQTPGNYYIYARFLDGAGNPTDGVVTAQVTLNEITKPSVQLPLIVK